MLQRAVLGAFDRRGRRDRHLPLLVSLVALVFIVLGGFIACYGAADAATLRVSAVIIIWIAAVVQLKIAQHIWRRRQMFRCEAAPVSTRLVLCWLLAGAVLCYAAALFAWPTADAPFLFVASLAGWQSLVVVPLAVEPAARAWRWLVSRAVIRRTAWTIFGACLLTSGLELVLRTCGLVSGDQLLASRDLESLKLPPGSEFHGRTVNSQGFWSDEFRAAVTPGRFRIAAVGGDATLSGTPETNYLNQLERLVPGLEVYNFGLRQATSRELSALLADDVLNYRPDLVLLFISAGDDLAPDSPPPGAFDSRSLKTCQLLVSFCSPRSPHSGEAMPCTKAAEERYLHRCEQQLDVCHAAVSAATQRRWEQLASRVDAMIEQCRGRNIPIALVLVPSDAQVNPILCDTIRRRLGYEPRELDLELPQRRLAGLADDRRIAVLDLLPVLKVCDSPPRGPRDSLWNDEGNTLAAQAMCRWLNGRFGGLIAATAQASAR